MTSSGTYGFSPSNGELVLASFERIQIRGPEVRAEHMGSSRRELNLLMVQFSNLQPNLWKVELDTVNLVSPTPTYTLPPQTVMILDAYLSLNTGTSQETDIYLTPMSRTQYATIANKTTTGQPTSYWLDRLPTPTVTFWPVPDNGGPYVFNYYACVQMQDANLPSGETPDVPYLWLDALVAGLSHRMARIYKPELEPMRKTDAKEAWDIAAAQNTEYVPFTLAPSIGSYYRR